ncbi:penicillin-binding protein PBP1A [Streptococcus pacificus]|uniref:Penicillin-binding protein n=1 Tax=Streptococcus pacificus TaxID=2740577 RepID=A0ABS0ZGK4_9STRE|nr:penicillin-binding protein [Streptococcus pacificus]
MIPINKKKVIKFLKYAISIGVSLIILAIIAGGLLFAYYVSSAPTLSEEKLNATSSSLVFDKNDNLIADLGSEKRETVSSDNIPIGLVNAITAIEDHRFFNHRGIDVYRIVGSALHNLTSSTTQGGSTLDQQLIKLAYFSTSEADQTLKRKAQEAWLALQMERQYTKEEILTFYINKVYMGNGNYGMLTAAKSYFGKDLTELSVAQLALLAGIPQAPSQYDPYGNPEAAQARRDIVLGQMYELKHITKEEYEEALATPVTDGLQELKENNSYPKYLDNYLKEVISEVEKETDQDIFSAGLKVYTNVDIDAQRYLWDIYNSDTYINYPDADFQVASTVIDVTNGKVIAQLGARNQDPNVSFGTNQAVLTDRDWGSTMKPISAYAPALDNRVYTSTAQSLNDSPYYWPGTSDPLYNWDRQYYGWMTMQTAIVQSRNIPAVKTLEATGLKKAQDFLEKLNINYPQMLYSNAISSNTSSGEAKYGASSEKMAAAYAAFSNGGIYYKPQYINKIEFNDGTVKTYEDSGSKAMEETTAYMMTDMMKKVMTYGTGTEAAISGIYQAGKTGTSNYTDQELSVIEERLGINPYSVGTMAPDENFVGYTPQYAMAVWTGYKDRLTPVYGDGLNIAARVYRQMMIYLTQDGNEDWQIPTGLYRSGDFLYLRGSFNTNTFTTTEETTTQETTTEETTQETTTQETTTEETTIVSEETVTNTQ